MSSQNSDYAKLVPLDVESLAFDSFGRNSVNDIVCVAPVRTIVRREEEIVLIRRVRKVEEIDASPACPVNTIQFGSYKLTVYANAGLQTREQDTISDKKEFVHTLWTNGKLPYIPNEQDEPIKVKLLNIEGKWNYGSSDFNELVGFNGNASMAPKETTEGDMLFTELRPAMLVAFKIEEQGEFQYKPVAYGEEMLKQEITLQPGEKLYFINNDQPGYYNDNDKELTVEWTIVS